MNVIGIDVSKETLVGVRTDNSTRVKEVYEFPNTITDIELFLDNIGERYPKAILASEATGEYHRLLAQSCVKRNIPFRLLNPITTKQFTKATIRKRKTDLSDSLVIAKLALRGEGNLVSENSFNLAKPALRTAIKLTTMEQMVVLMEQRLELISQTDIRLTSALTNCRGALKEATGIFHTYARESINPTYEELLCSIPGVGKKVATTLLLEIGEINRFPNSQALVAYSGLDPKVKQSGRGLHHNTKLTKRGSPYLRRMLFLAASIAQRHDPELKTYYEKKRGEGKFYKEATCAVARKILNRVYAVLKRGTPYVVRT